MGIKIKAQIITPKGSHKITLPQTQNEFDKTLQETGFHYYISEEHKIENAKSGIKELDKALTYATDIEELNYLAQVLSHLNEDEIEKFEDIIKADGNILSMRQIVNAAYNVDNMNFNIEQSIHDLDDLGAEYCNNNDPDTDEIILQNINDNGTINFEGVGLDLQLSQGGVFSDMGYICNFNEMTSKPYDGKCFPPFCYSGESVFGVRLVKRAEDNSIDIFLPTEGSVIRRAEKRIGAKLDRCVIKPCWGFPLPLAKSTLPASALGKLDTTAQRLSVLSQDELKNVFEKAENAEIKTADEFCEFMSERIREIQMPEAVNTLTYYFPLDVKVYDPEEDYDLCGDYPSMSSADSVEYIDEILGQIEEDNNYFETNRLLAEYMDEGSTLHNKIYDMLPTVQEHGGELWGAMVMKTAGELTRAEIKELKEYITGQNSDGYGEGLEQREIKVDGRELYVSFWSNDRDYTIYTQDEFADLQGNTQTASQQII